MTVVHDVREARSRLRHRPARWVAALAGASLLLASCGTAPGAGAVVDGQRFSEQTVQARTDAYIAENKDNTTDSPGSRVLYNQFQVNDIVRHQLVLAAAKAEHITVTDKQVNDFISQQGGASAVAPVLGVPADAARDGIYDYLVLQKLVDAMPSAGVDVTNVTVTLDLVSVPDRDAAIAARSRYLKDPAAMDADAAAARATGQMPPQQESLLANPQNATAGVFSAPEGAILVIYNGSDSYFVARVTKRAEEPAKLTKSTVQSAQGLEAFMVLASLLLSKYPAAKDVTINPRFGQWDPETLQVIAGNDGL